MKKIDLYEIAIKLLGLYLIVIILTELRDLILYSTAWIQQMNRPQSVEDFDHTPFIIISGFCCLLLIALSGFFIFRTKQIAERICNKTEYVENVKIFTGRKTIYEICLVLIGLITIVLALPDFMAILINRIVLIQSEIPTGSYDTTIIIALGLKIGIGVISILYASALSNLLTRKNKFTEESNSS